VPLALGLWAAPAALAVLLWLPQLRYRSAGSVPVGPGGSNLGIADSARLSGGHRNEMPMIGVLESEWGIIIILVVVVLVFGSTQLPKLARSLGSAQSEFKKGLAEGKKGDGSDDSATAKTGRGANPSGDTLDFVSRFFGPQSGVPEDPVTGSAHTTLTPYWSKRLGKKDLTAQQLSARKGYLRCKDAGARIEISGLAKTYLIGRLFA